MVRGEAAARVVTQIPGPGVKVSKQPPPIPSHQLNGASVCHKEPFRGQQGGDPRTGSLSEVGWGWLDAQKPESTAACSSWSLPGEGVARFHS